MTRLNRFSRLVAFEFSLGGSGRRTLYSPDRPSFHVFVSYASQKRPSVPRPRTTLPGLPSHRPSIGYIQHIYMVSPEHTYSVVRSMTRDPFIGRLNGRNPRTSGVRRSGPYELWHAVHFCLLLARISEQASKRIFYILASFTSKMQKRSVRSVKFEEKLR